MVFISLKEYETSAPVALTVEQRDVLRKVVPDLRIEVAPGESSAYLLTAGIASRSCRARATSRSRSCRSSRFSGCCFSCRIRLGLAKWGDRPFEMTMPDSLVEAVVPVFAHHLERALRRGVLQGYRTEEDALMGVRGRIRFDDQVRRRFGILLPVEVRFDDFTEDILENRLLKAALATLGSLRLAIRIQPSIAPPVQSRARSRLPADLQPAQRSLGQLHAPQRTLPRGS